MPAAQSRSLHVKECSGVVFRINFWKTRSDRGLFVQLHSLRHTLAFFADEITPASVADLRYVGTAAGIVTAVTLVAALAVFAGLLKVSLQDSPVAHRLFVCK